MSHPNQKSKIPDEVIASWGQAKLYKDFDGNLRLEGGSEKDRKEAQKWIQMFRPTSPRLQNAFNHHKNEQK